MQNLTTCAYITLIDKTKLFYSRPEDNEYRIETIAHALSHICRFSGHCETFYSVAQHSVLVAQRVPKEARLHALLHDAAEAFVVDMPSPLKVLLPEYRKIEDSISAAIFKKHNVVEYKHDVKVADLELLITEKRDILKDVEAWDWADGIEPLNIEIEALSSKEAKALFLDAYAKIRE